VAERDDVHRLVRPAAGLRSQTARLASGRKGSHLEFLSAVLPLIIALTTFCMLLLRGVLTGGDHNPMDRLIQQNQLLAGLVFLLAIAVLGLALKNLKGLRQR
jgi:hypothetical protein